MSQLATDIEIPPICAICSTPLKLSLNGMSVRVFQAPCKHRFHIPCLKVTFQQNAANYMIPCPLCGGDVGNLVDNKLTSTNVPTMQPITITTIPSLARPGIQTKYLSTSQPRTISCILPPLLPPEDNIDVPSISDTRSVDLTGTLPSFVTLNFSSQLLMDTCESEKRRFWAMATIKAVPPTTGGIPFFSLVIGGLDVVACVDRSSSMSHGVDFQIVKDALYRLIDGLTATDRLSLVVFDLTSLALCGLLRMDLDGKTIVRTLIRNLRVGKMGTMIWEAVELATHLLKARRKHNHVTTIFLLTDGQDYASKEKAHLALHSPLNWVTGCTLHVLGCGHTPNGSVCHTLSVLGNGSYHPIQTVEMFESAIQTILRGFVGLIAGSVCLRVSSLPNCGSTLRRVLTPYSITCDPLTTATLIELGSLALGDVKHIIFELVTSKVTEETPCSNPVLSGELSYTSLPGSQTNFTTTSVVTLGRRRSVVVFNPYNLDLELQLLRATVSLSLQISFDEVRCNRIVSARNILETQAFALLANPISTYPICQDLLHKLHEVLSQKELSSFVQKGQALFYSLT